MSHDIIKPRMDKFAETLVLLADLKKNGQWEEMIKMVGRHLGKLLGVSPQQFRRLSLDGILGMLINNGPMATVWFPYKQTMLVALLKEAGDYACWKKPPRGGNHLYLKALNLLLDSMAQEESHEYSQLAPTVECLLDALGDAPLPAGTVSRLIREHDRSHASATTRARITSALATRRT